jgi:ABC-type cobalamin/Fe3+-siderophores transport system ATPase subunit
MCFVAVLFIQTDERVSVSEDTSFVDYQTNLVRLAKQIARTAQEMVIVLHCLHTAFCMCHKARLHNSAIVRNFEYVDFQINQKSRVT